MPSYIRAFVPGGTFFFTVNLLERNRALLTDHMAELRTAFAFVSEQKPFVTRAYVILPDHLHCIWTLPTGAGGKHRSGERCVRCGIKDGKYP